MSSPLPRRVRAFVRAHVHSVGDLELLMLLYEASDRCWSAEEICEALACPASWPEVHLRAMAESGLVEQAGERWRFRPATDAMRAATDELAAIHRQRGRDIVRFIFTEPVPSSGR